MSGAASERDLAVPWRECLAEEMNFFAARLCTAAKQAAQERARAARAEKVALPQDMDEEETEAVED